MGFCTGPTRAGAVENVADNSQQHLRHQHIGDTDVANAVLSVASDIACATASVDRGGGQNGAEGC